MKKLNLLLATTAMLSMGAITANADLSETKNITVKANIVKTIELVKLKDINFGTMAWNTSVQNGSILLQPSNPDGLYVSGLNFHTGYEYGQICFNDLGEEATISISPITFKDGETTVATFAFPSFNTGDTAYNSSGFKEITADTGKRCFALGGNLNWTSSVDYAGVLSEDATVTVLYGYE